MFLLPGVPDAQEKGNNNEQRFICIFSYRGS